MCSKPRISTVCLEIEFRCRVELAGLKEISSSTMGAKLAHAAVGSLLPSPPTLARDSNGLRENPSGSLTAIVAESISIDRSSID
jgi:hypothetical protein